MTESKNSENQKFICNKKFYKKFYNHCSQCKDFSEIYGVYTDGVVNLIVDVYNIRFTKDIEGCMDLYHKFIKSVGFLKAVMEIAYVANKPIKERLFDLIASDSDDSD